MGQQPSKRASKKAKDGPDANALSPDSPAGASQTSLPESATSNGHQASLSKATGARTLSASSPTDNGAHHDSGSPSDSLAAAVATVQNGNAQHAAPSVLAANADFVSENQPAPIDVPSPTHATILSNPVQPSPLPPGSIPGNDKGRAFDVDDMINRLLEVGYSGKTHKSVCLKNPEITALCQTAREVFLSQPTLIELSPPVKVVGDVHGQYTDLIRLFEMCGFPPSSNYLFLGDYVDRGKQSLETILLLLCYKIKYPQNFFLLRGNHECANVTRVYGFYDECKRRCNIKIWKSFIDVFNCLPIAAVVASKIFCVHGGLSPALHSMDDIRRIQRPTDVPDYGLLNDLLWSDPSDSAVDWEDNERGVSYCFGKIIINEFLARYDMDLICRAHMVVEDGYEFWNDRTLVTVFSAPNYCGEFDNYGACMSVSEELLCAFELLKPLDGPALRKEMSKARRKSMGVPPST